MYTRQYTNNCEFLPTYACTDICMTISLILVVLPLLFSYKFGIIRSTGVNMTTGDVRDRQVIHRYFIDCAGYMGPCRPWKGVTICTISMKRHDMKTYLYSTQVQLTM